MQRGTGVAVIAGAPEGEQAFDLFALRRIIDFQNRSIPLGGQGRVHGLLETVDPHHALLSAFDGLDPQGVALHQGLLHVGVFYRAHRAPHFEHLLQFAARVAQQFLGQGFDDVGTLEEIGVFEQVGLVGEDLLGAERELLIPRAGQSQGLVPGGKLKRSRAGIPGEGDTEGFERDAYDVVLGLGLGEAEAVHLDPIAEAQHAGVVDAVALSAEFAPKRGHRPAFTGFLDETNACVEEEGDAPEDPAEGFLGYIVPGPHGVEDRHGVRHGESDFLNRGRPGFLQVIRADIDGVPLGNLRHRVGHHVARHADGGLGRKHVGAPGEILLDDVVLGRALELVGADTLAFSGGCVERQQPGRSGVDGHRRIHAVQGDLVEERGHVVDMTNRHTHLAHLSPGQGMIRVVPGLGGEVEGHGKTGLAAGEV